ncbi:MAG: lipid A biosynthesis lauroyl acyltransferase [Rhizobiales bacterium]|nr:lipid A biosynthesis lauroyl acyltransferase [Hyphomicrobiales bacterium]
MLVDGCLRDSRPLRSAPPRKNARFSGLFFARDLFSDCFQRSCLTETSCFTTNRRRKGARKRNVLKHYLRRFVRRMSDVFAPATAVLVRAYVGLLRLMGPDRASAFGGFMMRMIGPLAPAHRVAQENLRAAFPEKSEAERARILRGSWDSLGRTMTEYPFLQQLMDFDYQAPDPNSRTEVAGVDQFIALLESGKPAIIFAAHLANWELPAVAAARYGLDMNIVFRPPNNKAVARAIEVLRGGAMGRLLPSGPGAAGAMVGVLDRGGRLAMLADQHLTRGLMVTFMGRPALANPILAKLARRFDCPVHGARCIRLPGGRFRLELTPPLDLPHDGEGHIDVEGAMRAITGVIEGWIREHPEQWLWQHRRWRVPAPPRADGG